VAFPAVQNVIRTIYPRVAAIPAAVKPAVLAHAPAIAIHKDELDMPCTTLIERASKIGIASDFQYSLRVTAENPIGQEKIELINRVATSEQEHFALLWALNRVHDNPNDAECVVFPPMLIRAGIYSFDEITRILPSHRNPERAFNNNLMIAQRLEESPFTLEEIIPQLDDPLARVFSAAWSYFLEKGTAADLPIARNHLTSVSHSVRRFAMDFIALHGSTADLPAVWSAADKNPALTRTAQNVEDKLKGRDLTRPDRPMPVDRSSSYPPPQIATSEAEALAGIRSNDLEKEESGFAYFAVYLDLENISDEAAAAMKNAPAWVKQYLLVRLLKLDLPSTGIWDQTIPDYFGLCGNSNSYFETTARNRQYTIVNDGFFYKPTERGFQIALYLGKIDPTDPSRLFYFGGVYQPSSSEIDTIESSYARNLSSPEMRWNYLRDAGFRLEQILTILFEMRFNQT
jgi:hypothetical protein